MRVDVQYYIPHTVAGGLVRYADEDGDVPVLLICEATEYTAATRTNPAEGGEAEPIEAWITDADGKEMCKPVDPTEAAEWVDTCGQDWHADAMGRLAELLDDPRSDDE